MAGKFSFFIVCAALIPGAVSAQVVLSEIMYDLESGSDSGREWVEVFNSGGSSVTLTEWKLFENGTNHSLATYSGGEALVSGGYAIIADNPANFLSDNPGFSGVLFDSAFSLSNTGETLILRCCGSDLVDKDSVTYASTQGGAGDGKTLQRSTAGGSFTALTPTPGSGTLTAETGGSGNTETTLEEGSQSVGPNAGAGGGALSGAKPPPPPIPLYVNAGSDMAGIAGAPLTFNGEAYDSKKASVEDVHYAWTFGDGSAGEGKIVEHVYEYSGKYAVTLTVTKFERSATDTLVVTIEDPRLTLSIRDDGSALVTNGSTRAVDVSLWRIAQYQQTFVFPKGTSILPNSSLRISAKRLGFTASPQATLQFPDGVVAASIEESKEVLVEEDPPARTSLQYISAPRVTPETPVESEYMLPNEEEPATSSPFVASAAAGEVPAVFSLWFLGTLLLGFLGAGAVVLIRRTERGEWTIIEETDEKSV